MCEGCTSRSAQSWRCKTNTARNHCIKVSSTILFSSYTLIFILSSIKTAKSSQSCTIFWNVWAKKWDVYSNREHTRSVFHHFTVASSSSLLPSLPHRFVIASLLLCHSLSPATFTFRFRFTEYIIGGTVRSNIEKEKGDIPWAVRVKVTRKHVRFFFNLLIYVIDGKWCGKCNFISPFEKNDT